MRRLALFYFLFSLFFAPAAFAQLGALPYHFRITAVSGAGTAGNDFVVTLEIHDANHAVKGTDACKYSNAESPRAIKLCIAEKVNLRAATDAGGTAALIAAMVGVDNDMDSAPSPASGSDPWTYVVLASDFATTSGTAVDVTGLSFTPAANTRYEVQGEFLLRTATTTVGARPGLAWPTGMTDGQAWIWAASSATAAINAFGNINAAVLCANTGHPTTTQSYPSEISSTFTAGASPSGTFKMQLASETAGTQVTIKAGSFFRWRTIP